MAITKPKGPFLPDPNMYLQAGINPKTGQPLNIGESPRKEMIKRFLRVLDEEEAVNRFVWYNLPDGISSQELERLLYYKGQLVLFYAKDLDSFYFMPYALDGGIDFYGRYNEVHPVPMTSGTTDVEKQIFKNQAAYLATLRLKCLYDIPLNPIDDPTKYCVILRDYINQLPQTIIPRQQLNDELLDIEADILCYLTTVLMRGTGVAGMRVNDADEAHNVVEAAAHMRWCALNGIPWTSIEGTIEIQELADGTLTKVEEYMMAFQSIDNLRLRSYGVDNGGFYEKKQHMNDAEFSLNNANICLPQQDQLNLRQNFCDLVNALFGLGIWCEPSESLLQVDIDGDGVAYDNNDDGENSGQSTFDNGGGEDA